eukprot:gb/GEZN01007529.1/.p1 GENE.gb/GEZN01007529.1/~~gb/GEZN01007529.1/.p1  ORF type:complete len:480 (+),score=57.65 gb/GEZN01007529.1/:15-1454(+)
MSFLVGPRGFRQLSRASTRRNSRLNNRGFTTKTGPSHVAASDTCEDGALESHEPPLGVESDFHFKDVYLAHHRLRGGIVETPTRYAEVLSEITGVNVWLKKDLLQYTGSFKERGARNTIMLLLDQNPKQAKRGVIAASAGNHALALAWHGKQLGIPVTVVMPTVAPMAKISRCKKFGADVIIYGAHVGEARQKADELAIERKLKYVNGFDDYNIITGAGTMGIEILEQCPNADAIVVPIGGGGLIAGLATAVKTIKPEVSVIGVEPYFAASWTEALKYGKPTATKISVTLADGLAVPMVGARAFQIAHNRIDEVVLVNEKEIALAILRLVEHEKAIVEGAGAIGLGALLPGGPLYGRPELKGKNVVLLLCGGNIDTNVLGRVLERGLALDGRLVRFTCEVSDLPGGISRLTTVLAEVGVSIKDIFHERAWVTSSVQQVSIQIVCETTGQEHVDRLQAALKNSGYSARFDTRPGGSNNSK